MSKSLCLEVHLEMATGVPIPLETQVPRSSLIYRKLYVCFYDKQLNALKGNTCVVPGTWNPNYEDRWYLNQALNSERFNVEVNALANYFTELSASEHIIYVQMADFDKIKDKNYYLLFEFVLHCAASKDTGSSSKALQPDLEISCCYGMIQLEQLLTPGPKVVKLEGGEPSKPVAIRQQDVQTRRDGWRNIVKKLSAAITSSLKIEVQKNVRRHFASTQSPSAQQPPRPALRRTFLLVSTAVLSCSRRVACIRLSCLSAAHRFQRSRTRSC